MNALSLSVRYIFSRRLESLLALIGIVLGVSTLAGTLSLGSGYTTWFNEMSFSPEARQIQVFQASRQRLTDAPVVLIGSSEIQQIRFSAAEADAALAVCPDVLLRYEADYRNFATLVRKTKKKGDSLAVVSQPGVTGMQGVSNGLQAGAASPQDGSPVSPGPGFMQGGPGMNTDETAIELTDDMLTPLPETIRGAIITPDFFTAWNLNAQYGELFSKQGRVSDLPPVVVGGALATIIFDTITDPAEVVGKKLVLNNKLYRITAVLELTTAPSSNSRNSWNDMVFMPTEAIESGAQERNRARSLNYSVSREQSPARAAIQLENYFNSIYGEGTIVAHANLERFTQEISRRKKILLLMSLLAGASAFTSSINLFNLMTSRIVRRKKPIAILRAIGAPQQTVFYQLMLEASLIAISGTLCGLLFSPVVVSILVSVLEKGISGSAITVAMDIPVLFVVGGATFVVSLLCAFVPVQSGAHAVITDSLRSE